MSLRLLGGEKVKFISRTSVGALLLAMTVSTAMAQGFPSKPITLTVPFAPGASADGIARIVGKELSRSLGQPVIVENKPGGGGVTALSAVARLPADGYSLVMGGTGAIAVNPHVLGAIPFDAKRLLSPVAKVANIPLVLVTGQSSGIETLALALEKARKGELIYGSPGSYTAQHLSGELLASITQARLVPVHYRGSAPVVIDLLSGQLPLALVDLTAAAAHVRAGTLTALGVTTGQRTRLAPDIPTIAEAGVPGFAVAAWIGVFAPKGTPPEVLARLSKEIGAALTQPEVQQQIEALSAEPAYLDAAEFGKVITQESEKWRTLIAKIKPERR